jgi:hypothetical protein
MRTDFSGAVTDGGRRQELTDPLSLCVTPRSENPCPIMVLSAVDVCRRIVVSEALVPQRHVRRRLIGKVFDLHHLRWPLHPRRDGLRISHRNLFGNTKLYGR